MNLWLSKIETDLSRKLKEETRDSKVHRKTLRRINNEVKKPYVNKDEREKEGKKNKRFFTINGEIRTARKVSIEAKFPEVTEGQPSKGIFLDTKK